MIETEFYKIKYLVKSQKKKKSELRLHVPLTVGTAHHCAHCRYVLEIWQC